MLSGFPGPGRLGRAGRLASAGAPKTGRYFGWLLAALRISWKPVLGALVAAVALGLLADWLFPQADTLAQVLRSL